MGQFSKGQSGNPKGRPKAAEAASEIARGLVKKYALFERLARIAAGEIVDQPQGQASQAGSTAAAREAPSPPTTAEQINAMKLLLSYGYGTPVQMTEGAGATGPREVRVTFNYVEKQLIQNYGDGGTERDPQRLASGPEERAG